MPLTGNHTANTRAAAEHHSSPDRPSPKSSAARTKSKGATSSPAAAARARAASRQKLDSGSAGGSTRRKAPKKPSEPTKLLLAGALTLIVTTGLVVVGANYWLNRGGSEETAAADPEAPVATDETGSAGAPVAPGDTASAEGGSPSDLLEGSPLLFVADDAAATGPLMAGIQYQMEMLADPTPEDTTYSYVLDGEVQPETFSELPPLTFDAGRHTVGLQQNSPGQEPFAGTEIAVYVIGEPPVSGNWANIKSVNIETEGWVEALSQYDQLVQIHPELKMVASDDYPSLPEGWWIMYVEGFSGSDDAIAYCDSKGLAVPDDCFHREFDPAGSA